MHGGSFAPPIGDEKLARCREIAETAAAEMKEPLLKLVKMLEVFFETPSTSSEKLSPEECARIWEYVPWEHELQGIQKLFDTLPNGPKGSPEWKLRDAAFHLLWYAYHLTKDLEPMTTDRL